MIMKTFMSKALGAFSFFTKPLFALIVLSSFFTMPIQAAKVEIEWLNSEKYQDIAHSATSQDEFQREVFETLQDKLSSLASGLPEEQVLRVKVYDLDLAGVVIENEGEKRREVTSEEYPKIKFTYKLVSQNFEGEQLISENIVKAGGTLLKKVDFLDESQGLEQTFLNYEQQMLEEWFDFTFLPRDWS